MSKTTILLLCALALSAAISLADDDLDVLWEDPYDLSLMNGGFPSYGPHYTQDDFTLETDSVIKAVECWAFYYPDDSDPHPQPFYVTLRYDHYGMPGGIYIASYSYDVEETDTGDDYLGEYPVYHYWLNLMDDIGIEAGTPFWLELYATTENFNWAARSRGNLHYMWNEYDFSAFFRLLGTADAGVVDSSWGEIKAGYLE